MSRSRSLSPEPPSDEVAPSRSAWGGESSSTRTKPRGRLQPAITFSPRSHQELTVADLNSPKGGTTPQPGSKEAPSPSPETSEYIPLSAQDILALFKQQHPEHFSDSETAEKLQMLLTRMQLTNQVNILSHFMSWQDAYRLFSPDIKWGETPNEVKDVVLNNMFQSFKETFLDVVEKGGWGRVSAAELAAAVHQKSMSGVEVVQPDQTSYHMHMFYRGRAQVERKYRSWKTLFFWRTYKGQMYRHLIVLFKVLEATDHHNDSFGGIQPDKWYLKMFKDFAVDDVDMLVPGSSVKVGMFDILAIAVPCLVGAVAAILKIFHGSLSFGTPRHALSTLVLVVGPLLYAVKGYMGFLDKKQQYSSQKSIYLMYKLAGTNQGVLSKVLAQANQQDVAEFILAFLFLWNGQDNPKPAALPELKEKVEAFLAPYVPPDSKFTFPVDKIGELLEFWTVAQHVTGDDKTPRLKVRNLDQTLKKFHEWDPHTFPEIISWHTMRTGVTEVEHPTKNSDAHFTTRIEVE